MRNKSRIEQESIKHVSKNDLIWFYDPIKDEIEWIGLLELVQNLITEQFDELIDPLKIICGCSFVPLGSSVLTRDSSFYKSTPIMIEQVQPQREANLRIPRIEYTHYKCFQERNLRPMKRSDLKLKQIRKKSKTRKEKVKSKKSKTQKRQKKKVSQHSKRFHSSNVDFNPYLARAEKSRRSKSYRIAGKSQGGSKSISRKRKSEAD